MKDKNFEESYEMICKKIFNFLIEQFKFEYIETKKIGFGIFSTFKNNKIKIRVEIWFDIRDRYADIVLAHWTETSSYSPSLRIDELLLSKSLPLNLKHTIPEDDISALKQFFKQCANILQKYGCEILKNGIIGSVRQEADINKP